MEACGTAHFWAREIAAFGHEVRLMPPGYVKPYVKRNKHDAADAEAVCEAVRRPSMRFVPIKTKEQQAALLAHSIRDLLVRQRTMLVNALRGHLAEFGIVAPRGIHKVGELTTIIGDESSGGIPPSARSALGALATELAALDLRVRVIESEIVARTNYEIGGSRRTSTAQAPCRLMNCRATVLNKVAIIHDRQNTARTTPAPAIGSHAAKRGACRRPFLP
jgi:transposase